MIYLAAPYSHQYAHVRAARFKRIKQATCQLMCAGDVVFSPVAYGYLMEEAAGKTMSHDYWMQFCLNIMPACDRVYVLTLEGWDQSKGVAEEVKLAKRMGKPIIGYQNGDWCEDLTGWEIAKVILEERRLETPE